MAYSETGGQYTQAGLEAAQSQALHSSVPEFVDAKYVAQMLGMDVDWVYANKHELGAIPMGDGPSPRWRFEVAYVREAMAHRRNAYSHPQMRMAQAPIKTRRKRSPDNTDVSDDFALPLVQRR